MADMLIPAIIGAGVACALLVIARWMSLYFDLREARDEAQRLESQPLLPMVGLGDARINPEAAEAEGNVVVRRSDIVGAH